MPPAARSAIDLPWLRVGVEAWYFGLEASMLAISALHTIGEMTLRALPDRADSSARAVTSLATTVNAASQAVEPTLPDHELLAAVLPHDVPGDEIRDSPLRMYAGVQDIAPWCYDR